MPELLRTLFITTPGTSLHLENDTVRIYHPDGTSFRCCASTTSACGMASISATTC